MANLCDITYKCVGDSEEVESLYKILEDLRQKQESSTDYLGKDWLGHLVNALGGNAEKEQCRGEIVDFDFCDNIVTIWQSTKWCEQEDVRKNIKRKFPSIKVYYMEEEPGCCIFTTNDAEGCFFPDRYRLEMFDDDESPNYFETIKEAAETVSELVGTKVEPTQEAVEKALDGDKYIERQNSEDAWYSFNEFTIVE